MDLTLTLTYSTPKALAMTSLLPVSRIWPGLVRLLGNHAASSFQPYGANGAQQRFIPMAVLLDEAQAYKPAPSCQPSAIALSKPFRNQ